MQQEAMKYVQEKLENGQLEVSQGPYRSQYFWVEKKANGTYQMINNI